MNKRIKSPKGGWLPPGPSPNQTWAEYNEEVVPKRFRRKFISRGSNNKKQGRLEKS